MVGLNSEYLSKMLRDNDILRLNGLTAITFVEAFKGVEQLTTKQLNTMRNSNTKRANTTFRIHSLDRALADHITADLPVEHNTPGRLRLLFKIKNSGLRLSAQHSS
mmetsp:Transcript_40960/g.63929  ORF Transcript_40960/g.63929 Transcript_40960/m.63929 type:complete len:106 (-) Transcript_40960:339-656(-)